MIIAFLLASLSLQPQRPPLACHLECTAVETIKVCNGRNYPANAITPCKAPQLVEVCSEWHRVCSFEGMTPIAPWPTGRARP